MQTVTTRRFLFGFIVLALTVGPVALAQNSGPSISIEPNVLVTNDIAMGHTESDVAVNPLNPRDILGATTVFGSRNGPPFNKTYASLDGGYTWTDTTPYVAKQDTTGDPRAAFTNLGTALFVSLNLTQRTTDVYRSSNGGITWGSSTHFPIFDHELVAVDRTHGRYAGRIYIAGEADEHRSPHNPMGGDRYIYLYTSDNDGRSFVLRSKPETGLLGVGQLFNGGGVAVVGLNVLSDGTVALALSRYFQIKIGFERNYVAMSANGGLTFSKPVRVADLFMYNNATDSFAKYGKRAVEASRMGDASLQGQTFAMALDSSTGPYRDRLYAVLPDRRSGHGRIIYSYSVNHGKTWTVPRTVGIINPTEAQFQPMISVNNQGAVAVAWFSTAGFASRTRFNAYVAISTDGGKTFSAPARVSSASSLPREAGNLIPVPLTFSTASARAPGFISAYSRWGAGGDYIGMDAGSDGVFHFYWPDSRGAEYEMYSARIHAGAGLAAPGSASAHDVTSDIVLAFDPLSVDVATGEIDIPVRVKNVSQQTLFGPISVTFLGAQSAAAKQYNRVAPPMKVLNASSGGAGYGATFDYSKTLGSFGGLPPGGVTEPVMWRFRVSDLDNLAGIALNVRVTARY